MVWASFSYIPGDLQGCGRCTGLVSCEVFLGSWAHVTSFAGTMRRKGSGRGEGKVDKVGMAVVSALLFKLRANKIGDCYE